MQESVSTNNARSFTCDLPITSLTLHWLRVLSQQIANRRSPCLTFRVHRSALHAAVGLPSLDRCMVPVDYAVFPAAIDGHFVVSPLSD